MDIIGPFPSAGPNHFIISFQDTFSGYNIAMANPDHTTTTVACALIE